MRTIYEKKKGKKKSNTNLQKNGREKRIYVVANGGVTGRG